MKDFIGKIVAMFDAEPQAGPAVDPEQVRVAAAALLIHAMLIDDRASDEEQVATRKILRERFEIDEAEISTLMAKATAVEEMAVDLYRFTRVLAANLDQSGRQEIVRMLWTVVISDGEIDEFESNLVWRVAELLGVSREDRIRIRQEAQAASAF